ncbi:MAG: hypothetical protein GXO20_03760 [Thermodesulfobacteria bacterium]|nr:hypothetical protein [Thermodesulfobacteriota bacterium]
MKSGIAGQKLPVEDLAREILTQARKLTERLAELSSEAGLSLPSEKFQDAFVSFSQILMLAHLKSSPSTPGEEFERELFLTLARLVLKELLLREPAENEFEYFLAYYRSHFELLKKELEMESQAPSSLPPENPEEILTLYLERFLSQEGEVSH